MVTVKCLEQWQMNYILKHHEEKTAKDMADNLKVEKHKVTLFCQSNGIEPKQLRRSYKKRTDNYHIPFMPFNYKLHKRL
jgi:hypothetical protein